MNLVLRRALATGALLAMLGSAVGTARAADAPKVEKPKLVFGIIPTPDYVPVEIAVQKGYFKDEGLDVTVRIVPTVGVIPGMLGGTIDIAGLNWIVTLVAYNHGVPIRVAAEADRGVAHYAEIVVKTDSPIKSVRDLVGKKMASPSAPPGNCDVPVRIEMRSMKADDANVGFTDLAIPQMPATLASGGIDAACLPEPLLSAVKPAGAIRSIFDVFGGPRVGTPVVAFATTADFAEKNPNTLAALKRAIARAERFCVDHQDELRATLPAFNHITPEQAKAVVLPTYVTRPDQGAVNRLAKALVDTGFLPASPKIPIIGGP
jgi:NitT/TauT family transport system substrate-binding protein